MQQLLAQPRFAPGLVMLVSFAALAGAFASEAWGGLLPCILCIYQRYAYGVAFVFGLAGVGFGTVPRLRRGCLILAGLTFLVGASIAFFHTGVERHWWRGTPECHAPQFDPDASVEQLREQMLNTNFVPCDEIPWSIFGLSMANYNVIFSLIFAAACFYAARAIGREPAT